MSIRDFFKKKEPGDPILTPAIKASPAKRPIIIDDVDDFQEPDQKLKRSTRSLVKSKSTVSKAESPKKEKNVTPIIIDSSPVKSPKKVSPVKKERNSPVKKEATPVKKAPAKERTSPAKPASKKRAHNVEDEEFEPEEAPKTEAKKFNYREYLAKKNTIPVALGSKEVPEGAPNCFEGIAFLFTGDLSSITRDQAQDIVKRYGGRCVSAPSKKTNYVVVGANPGPSKMDKVEALGLKCIDEDEFFDLLRQSNPSGTPPITSIVVEEKKEPEFLPMRFDEHIEPVNASDFSDDSGSDLWTVKYAPHNNKELIGNPGIYEKLTDWLSNWNASTSENRAALLSGPPGIGKTTMSNLVCKELGYDSIEMNASDTRSKKTLHETVREIIDCSSIGKSMFFSKNKSEPSVTKMHVLIMDEVDGMSAGDRGGMAELILLIKKTKIPIICICNDRSSPKVRSLANHCLDLRLRRPDARQVVPRIKAIAEKEGLSIAPNAIEELVTATHGDIRQILNLLSTFKLTRGNLSYDASKALSIASSKDVEHGPFDATSNLLSGSLWSKMNLMEKIDQYFIDNSLVPLMIHENYMKCKATSPREIISTRNAKPNFIELTAAAADALSISDRVDSLIRGSNQEWSLAPLHGVMSSVLPSYYVHGAMGGRIDFAGWLGQNSRTSKNLRLLNEITHHIFLHSSTGKLELRLDYMSTFASSIVMPLAKHGQDGIETVINFMDDYSLSRDDIDSILEMVLDANTNSAAFSKVPTQVRSAFTRKYNQGVHRLPYSLSSTPAIVKKVSTDVGSADGLNDEDEAAVLSDTGDDQSAEEDITKDKSIKVKTKPSTKKTTTKAAASKKK